MALRVDHLAVANRLAPQNFLLARSEMLGVIGANGAGKSSLLRAIVGDDPATGRCVFQDRDLAQWPRIPRARCVAYLAQACPLSFAFTVHEVIALARSPHATGQAVDRAIVADVAHALDIAHLLDRVYPRLSGGEQQRVQLARVLAQVWRTEDAPASRLLLLDEPVASLDIGHQTQVMTVLARLAADGVAVLFVVHDVTLAAAHAHRLLALKAGRAIALGAPGDVVTESVMDQVYDAKTEVILHPRTGSPVLLHA